MTTEKVKPTKGERMSEQHDLQHAARELIGDKAIEGFFKEAQDRAEIRVAKNKKDMTPTEKEEYRGACFRKEAWEMLREFTVDAAQPRIMSWRWWGDASLKAVVNAVVLGGGLVVAGAITRSMSTTEETETTTETTEGDNPFNFNASERPHTTRRSSKVEAVI